MSTLVFRPPRALARLTAALALCGASAFPLAPAALAQQGTGRITGLVSGAAGQPIDNAQVMLVGTRLGTLTGADGRYTLTAVPPGTYQVRVQRIGFAPVTKPATVTDGGTATADFTLTAIAVTLSEVAVVGYTTQQRRDISDATAGVTAADLKDQKVATVEEALRGRLPGVQISASGEPGRAAQVIIRGQAFLGNASPLYVVDGMYMNQNPNLNPDDVESIEVLKDASAAAQYGAQAANGVVVIRTKRGKAGENRVEVRSYYGMQDIPKRVDMMNAREWAALTRQAYENAYPNVVGHNIPTGALDENLHFNTDWQDAVFKQGAIQDHNVTVSGGSQSSSYLLSGGYMKQDGAVIQTGFERLSFRVNSEVGRGRFTFGENLALSSSKRQYLNGFPLIDVLRLPPTIPVRDQSNIGGFGIGSDAVPTFGTNPVGAMLLQDNSGRSNQAMGNAYAEVGLIRQLKYRFNAGVSYEAYGQRNFIQRGILRFRGPNDPARLTVDRNDNMSLLFENLLTFDDAFSDGAHRLTAVAGYTEQRHRFTPLQAYREGFTDEGLRTINAGNRPNLNNSGTEFEDALRAMLVRANYAFRDRYLITASVRRDGSSRFAPSNRYGNFGAASVGWVMSDEGFYRGIPLLNRANYLKLRASHGVLGNQDIGDYQYAAPINQNLNYLFGSSSVVGGATQLSLANPDIRWQNNKQTNFGLDLGLLGDRLTITTDYYRSRSDGLLVNAPIPWSLGATGTPVVNAGVVQNSGFELGANHRYDRGRFKLNTNLNLTTTHNEVVSLGNGGQPIYAGTFGVARTAVGSPIGTFWVRQTDGIFQSDEEVQKHTTKLKNGDVKVLQPNAKAGDIRYVDRNHDGVINDDDRYDAGNAIPKLVAGLFFDGDVGNFDFALNFRGSFGSKVFNVARYWTDRMDDLSNYRKGLQPWTPKNHSTTTPRAVAGTQGAENALAASDRWIESGTFVRVQNIVIGYRLPSSIGNFAGLRDVRPRVYLNLQNLHTFTKFSNWDPETLGGGDALARGIDDGAIYPNVRTITFGIDLRL